MKKLIGLSLIALLSLGFVGCDDDDNPVISDPIPATPQGVFSITGDNVVHVIFNGIYDHDVDFYRVYRSREEFNNYNAIGTVDAIDNPNLDLIQYRYDDMSVTNGVNPPYFYAVTSVDFAGQESALSAETVFDTPRPEGDQVLLADSVVGADDAGYDFSSDLRVADTSALADIFVDLFNGVIYLNAANDSTDIQDMGYTYPIDWNGTELAFDDITYAPDNGWSALGYVEVVVGHTYIVWTGDNHFAKIRVYNANPNTGAVEFNYAYQTDQGNPELSFPEEPEPDRVIQYREKSHSVQ